MEDIKIPYKKSPIIMSTVLSFGVVLLIVVALWFVSPRFDTGPGIVRTLALYGFGGLAMLFAGTLGLLGLLKWLDRRPAIILGRRGLQLHRSGTIDGVIPWPHIEAFEVTALKKQKLLIVKLIEPDWFIANAPAGKRWRGGGQSRDYCIGEHRPLVRCNIRSLPVS